MLSLSQLLAPYGRDEFLSSVWGKDHLYVQGEPSKFTGLFSWEALNRILAQHRLEPPRLRLTKEGASLDQLSFLDYRPARRGGLVPRINVEQLYEQLRLGATLVVDAVDEMETTISSTCEELTKNFLTHIQVNAYASWGESRGFGLHWDDHDVLVIQIAGRKHWKIFGSTREFPLYKDIVPNIDRPTTPLWERIIQAGDLLYIPRGHWHDVVATNEPTLHLTFGINNPTGIDLMEWLIDEMRERSKFRKDLPLFGDHGSREQWVRELQEELLGRWNERLIDDFFDYKVGKLGPRPHLSLPHAAESKHSLVDGLRVRYSGATFPRIQVDQEAGTITVIASGRELTLNLKAEAIIKGLLSHQIFMVSELLDLAPEDIPPNSVRDLLHSLLQQGIIYIVE